jgi:hypothetical protein
MLVPLLVPLMLPLLPHGWPAIPQGRFDPEPILRRAERRTAQGVSVDLAALSAAEANALVGFDITKSGIQPVWVRVHNREGVRYYIPPISIDDDYFSPHEVAWKGHRWFDPAGNSRLDQRLRGLDLPEAVEPGGMVGGYVFTNRDEGLKYANVELVAPGQRKVRRFPFLVKVPGCARISKGSTGSTCWPPVANRIWKSQPSGAGSKICPVAPSAATAAPPPIPSTSS